MKCKDLLIGALVIAILPMGMAMAGPGGPRGQRGECEMGPCKVGPQNMLNMFDRISEMMSKQLNLTEEQKAKYAEIVKSNRAVLESIIKQLEDQKAKFKSELEGILTKEQKEKLERLEKRHERMMKRGKMAKNRKNRDAAGMLTTAISELDLPKEKAEKINAIIANAKAEFKKLKESDTEIKDFRAERGDIMRDMMHDIGDILSGNEMNELQEAMRAQMGPRDDRGPRGDRGQRGRGMGPGRRGGPNSQPTPFEEDDD